MIISCSKEGLDRDGSSEFKSRLKFSDVKKIALTNCATSGCHDGQVMFSLSTREDFYRRKPRPLNAIQRGSMPKDNPGFGDSSDGRLLVEWLSGSQEE